MKKLLLPLILLLTLATTLSLALAPVALAATCNGVTTSIDFGCDKYQTDSISAIIMYVIGFMAIGVGIAVVAGIVWGGVTYARSDGDSSTAKQGMDTIRNAIIGLVLFIFMYAAADFLIPGGAFNLNEKLATPATPTTPAPKDKNTPGTDDKATPASLAKISSVRNIRDAGAGGAIKSGALYRSGFLADASTADKEVLAELLKGGLVIDLRTSDNKSKDGKDPKLEGVAHTDIPIVGTTNYTKFVNGKDGEKASAAFGKALKAIANADGPVLIHCTHGKDRTGWLAAMAMYAVGASDGQVMTEYMKSSGQTAGKNVTEDMLNVGLSAVKKKYGTVQKYLTDGLGLTSGDIAALKKKLAA